MSGQHDAVARLAGLDQSRTDWTPEALIRRFCQPGQGSAWRTEEREGSTFHAGFCGFDGISGFDDGYSMMAALAGTPGWHALPEVGDWPYVIYMAYVQPGRGAPLLAEFAVAHYCEGDFAIEVFESKEAANRALATIRKESPAP